MTTESQKLREEGNKVYKSITDDLAPVVQRNRLEKCIGSYNRAMAAAFTHYDKTAASKNLGMASYRMFTFLQGQEEDEKLVTFYLLEAFKNFSVALERGREQSIEWRQHLVEKVTECVECWMTSLVHPLPCEGRAGALEKVVDKIPTCAKTTVCLELADSLFKSAVKRQESNWKECLRYLHECYHPLEEAKLHCSDEIQAIDIQVLQEDIIIQMSVAEARMAIITGEELLKTVLTDEESLNIDMVWEIIDWFKKAIIQSREKELEVEAIAISKMGSVYDKILKMKDQAKKCFRQCLDLAHCLHPKVFTAEEWFQDATQTLERYQQEYQRAENEKWENKRKKYVEELKPELEKLKKIVTEVPKCWSNGEEQRKSRKKFLEKIYKKFPPKNSQFKMPTIDLKDEELESMKKAYQKAVTHYHPDRQKEEDGLKWKVLAEEICKELTSRYEMMK